MRLTKKDGGECSIFGFKKMSSLSLENLFKRFFYLLSNFRRVHFPPDMIINKIKKTM